MQGLEFTLLSSFFIGHFVHNIFVFENPTSYLYFFFLLGYVQYLVRASQGVTLKDMNTPISYGKIGGVAFVVLLFVFTTNINPAKANMATLDAIQGLYQGTGEELYEEATTIPTPHIDDVRNDFARSIHTVAPQYEQIGETERAISLLRLGVAELEKNKSLHPLDIRVHLMQANLYQQLATLTGETQYVLEARDTLEVALALSPDRQQVLFTLASVEQQLGNLDRFGELLYTAWELDPVVGEPWVRLLSYYGGTQQFEKAVALLEMFDEMEDSIRFNTAERETWEALRTQVEIDAVTAGVIDTVTMSSST
jgi:hypothetical protein